ncbi:hypothetical protein GCM10010317_003690 [Streptomyces mirabilis]|nr:hypothetical protein GCM10010317_003690 [Streptomyces mirabilis]
MERRTTPGLLGARGTARPAPTGGQPNERPCTRTPAPGYPEETRTVGGCLEVVMDEECEHLRLAVRDLAVLEAAGRDLP